MNLLFVSTAEPHRAAASYFTAYCKMNTEPAPYKKIIKGIRSGPERLKRRKRNLT
jgi:hypothetical protein